MGKGNFSYETVIDTPLAKVWDFFNEPHNLAKISSFPKVKINNVQKTKIGNEISMQLKFILFSIQWRGSIIEVNEEEHYFVDVLQERTFIYKKWNHRHSFSQMSEYRTLMMDHIEYDSYLPTWLMTIILQKMFKEREKMIRKLIQKG